MWSNQLLMHVSVNFQTILQFHFFVHRIFVRDIGPGHTDYPTGLSLRTKRRLLAMESLELSGLFGFMCQN